MSEPPGSRWELREQLLVAASSLLSWTHKVTPGASGNSVAGLADLPKSRSAVLGKVFLPGCPRSLDASSWGWSCSYPPRPSYSMESLSPPPTQGNTHPKRELAPQEGAGSDHHRRVIETPDPQVAKVAPRAGPASSLGPDWRLWLEPRRTVHQTWCHSWGALQVRNPPHGQAEESQHL